ncbi:hypothetical protein sscle_01g006560 [Sclerotinia sclerotiorum 1980 UF-70]|uniref:Nicotianamine synthase n=1 Tax=Sclerotinia sclerotiorum (strain ATCC 18683 / 1980 / Ss-1) TaxID=665079 RepID=A0A1D9PT90_SCLS1|nr:hypothetical protein sscle_01g006560 [Sclerotinia sclerotiorum 1980 UF-70]
MSNMDRMTTCSLLSSIKELFQKSQTPSASSKRSSTSIVPIPDLGKLDIIENTTCPQTEFYVQEILSIYTLLSQLTDFSPSPTINVLFSDLVGTCITIVPDSISKGVLGDPRISSILPALRVICSTAEACMESYWAEAISNTKSIEDAHRVLATFPYHKNYERLTRFELAAISSTGFFLSPTTKIAFIGSGPMPLTSLCILSALSTSDHMSCTLSSNSSIPLPLPRQSPVTPPTIITNIDSNPTANTQAQNLCTSLGGLPSTGMRFITALAGSNDLDLSDYDIIWLAALVGGIQADKEEILKNVVRKMKKGSLLIMRGAWGLRSVLYCDFDVTTQAVSTYLDICVRMDPFGDVVNSVIVGRVK